MVNEMSLLSATVMTLREFQREAARKHDEARKIRRPDNENTKPEMFIKKPKGREQRDDLPPVRMISHQQNAV